MTRDSLGEFPRVKPDEMWEALAKHHHDKREWVSADLAAKVADAMRFYRLHIECAGNEKWQP